jgi:hypothetical protein
VDDPYEAPESPELVVDTLVETPEQSLQKVMDRLAELGHIEDATLQVEGDRVHSGMTDLRITESGHVAEEH